MTLVPLHNHSEFSNVPSKDGFSTMEEITTRIREIGAEHVGLTDHGVVSGHLQFGSACEKAGIHPIFGIEAYQARTKVGDRHKDEKTGRVGRKNDAFHTILLAQTNVGLKNLWSISSRAQVEGFYYDPRMDWDILADHAEGVICTSACMAGYVAWEAQNDKTDALEKYLSIFGDRFYIEIGTYDSDHQRELNVELVRLATKFGIPLVYANDAHFACGDDHEAHETLLAIRENKKIDDPERVMSHPNCLWIMGEEDVRKSLDYLPRSVVDEALANSVSIAESCTAELPKSKNRVPRYHKLAPKESARRRLLDLIKVGMEERSLDSEEYVLRARDELKVVLEHDHLVNYFLIQQDITNWARENKIMVGPGRGSVGGSLIAYALGITDIDPLRYGLIFERFYNAGRAQGGLPDIDIDFPTSLRDTVKEYVAESYGKDRVADIGTVIKMGPKSAINKVEMVMKIGDRPALEAIRQVCDSYVDAGLSASWEEIRKDPEIQAFADKYPDFIRRVDALQGRVFTSGVHASGVLISDDPLAESFPVKWVASKKTIATQFDMHEAEDLGFMKNDMLGLTRLETLDEFRKIVQIRHGIDFEFGIHHWSDEDIAKHDMWSLLRDGLTIGVFQLENGAYARQLVKEISPNSIDSLAAVFALNRPGPIRSGSAESFVRRYKGEETYNIRPGLEDILDNTFGLFVYQEQVIQTMTAIGFSLLEADNVRRIMGKKKPEEMEALRPKFMEKAVPYFGSEDAASGVWAEIEEFSRYGFNLSHAVGYSVLAAWCLKAKQEYPLEFILACIRTDPDNLALYVSEARRMGIKVLPPDINESGLRTDIVGDKILFGLYDVKGVKSGLGWVVANRPYKSYDDLLEKLEEANEEAKKEGKSVKRQVSAGKLKALREAGAFDSIEPTDVSITDRRKIEKELFGVVLSNEAATLIEDNYDLLSDNFTKLGMVDSETLPGDEVVTFGYIADRLDTKTANGYPMIWIQVESGPDTMKLPVFGGACKKYDYALQEFTPVLLQIRKGDNGRLSLRKARVLSGEILAGLDVN